MWMVLAPCSAESLLKACLGRAHLSKRAFAAFSMSFCCRLLRDLRNFWSLRKNFLFLPSLRINSKFDGSFSPFLAPRAFSLGQTSPALFA